MKKKLKYIIVPVIIFIVLQLLFLSSFWQSLEHKSRDLFFIMRGEQPISEDVVIVEVGDEKREVSKDTLIESPKDIVHCWYNESEELLRFMVIKAPKPTKKTVFIGD